MLKAIACLVCKVVLCLSVFVISFPCFVGNKIFLHYLHIIIMHSFFIKHNDVILTVLAAVYTHV